MERNCRGCRQRMTVSHERPVVGNLGRGRTGETSVPRRVGRPVPAPAPRSGAGVMAGSNRQPDGARGNAGPRLRRGRPRRETAPGIIHACNPARRAGAGDTSRRAATASAALDRGGADPGSAESTAAPGCDHHATALTRLREPPAPAGPPAPSTLAYPLSPADRAELERSMPDDLLGSTLATQPGMYGSLAGFSSGGIPEMIGDLGPPPMLRVFQQAAARGCRARSRLPSRHRCQGPGGPRW